MEVKLLLIRLWRIRLNGRQCGCDLGSLKISYRKFQKKIKLILATLNGSFKVIKQIIRLWGIRLKGRPHGHS